MSTTDAPLRRSILSRSTGFIARITPALDALATERAVVSAYAVFCAWAGGQIWLDESMSTQAFLPSLWPYIFGIAAVLLVIYDLRPHSRKLLAVAGGFTVAAFASRCWALITAVLVNDIEPTNGIFVGAAAWALMSYTTFVIWTRILSPALKARDALAAEAEEHR